MNDTKYSRSERLSSRRELDRVKKEGRRRVLPELVLFFYPGRKTARLVLPPPKRSVRPSFATGIDENLGNSIASTKICFYRTCTSSFYFERAFLIGQSCIHG